MNLNIKLGFMKRFKSYYNSIWYVLYDLINTYGVEEGYRKLLSEYDLNNKKYSGYFEMIAAYINDYNQIKLSMNPDYFKFVNVENLTELEKKTVYILAASVDLKVNRPFFSIIFEKIIKENNIEGKYSNILAKYILKFMITKNKEYIIKNLISEIFGDHILYKNLEKNKIILYTPYEKDEERRKIIRYIKKFFLSEEEEIRVFWKKHFLYFNNYEVSKLDQVVSY